MKFSPVIFLTSIKEISFEKREYSCPVCLMEAKEIARCGVGTGTRQVGQDRLLGAVLAFCVLGKWTLC